MKKLFLFIAVMVCLLLITAGTFPPSTAYNTTSTNLISTVTGTANTNPVSNYVYVEQDLYHTIYVQCQTNVNGLIWVPDYSLDGTNWLAGLTNTSAVLTTNIFQTNFVAKVGYIRVRVYGTNMTLQVNYLGGR